MHELVTEANDEINADFLGFLRTFLLVFAGIALLVATFSINNTFSIIVAQRQRDLRVVARRRRRPPPGARRGRRSRRSSSAWWRRLAGVRRSVC